MKSKNDYRVDPDALAAVQPYERITLESGDDGESTYQTSALRLRSGWIVTTKYTAMQGIAPPVPSVSSVFVAEI